MRVIFAILFILLVSLFLPSKAGEGSLKDSSVVSGENAGCRLNVEGDLPSPLPLILTIEDSPRFVLPDVNGIVRIPAGRSVRVVCTGSWNLLPAIGYQDANVECISGTKFTVPTLDGYKQTEFVELKCANHTENTAKYSANQDPDCQTPLLSFEVGFTLPKDKKFVILYEGCFDARKLNTVYSKFVMTPSIGWLQGGLPFNGSLYAAGFYGSKDLDALYFPAAQREVVSRLLGSSGLGSKYIDIEAGRFLSPGLLTTDGDFFYSFQKNGTHYFVNSAPKWQHADSRNWYDLDDSLREYASNYGYKLLVWSGTYGVMTLPDSNGTQKKLSISINENGHGLIDVPAILWRVAIEPKSGLAVAFAGVNNPYLVTIPDSLMLCDSVCDKLEWLTWSPEVIDGGYSYCCEVDEIRKTIKTIPDLEVKGLLGMSISSRNMQSSILLLKLIVIVLSQCHVTAHCNI